MNRKMLRTTQLDRSDLSVFERAAEPGEWAVPGSFAFTEEDPEQMVRKRRLAFGTGWLGLNSFGFSTFVEIVEIDDLAFERAVQALAEHFVDAYGAPSAEIAFPVAREELGYAESLADQKIHTLMALSRELEDGAIREQFRIIDPTRATDHAKIWDIVPEE